MNLLRHDHQENKVDQAVERQAYYDSLSYKQRLERLDARLGKGVGAKKERERLIKLIANPPAPKVEPKVEEVKVEQEAVTEAKPRQKKWKATRNASGSKVYKR